MKPSDPDTIRAEPAGDDEPHTVARAESVPAELGYGALANTLASYELGEVIGKGGMGEVVTARDQRIGRDVALKRLNTPAPTDAEARGFLREARIQARLDHPAVVPVHELGRDALGRPYFTMKRVTGLTLREQIPTEPAGSRRLLRAFAEVCLAVEFAHMRGVVHRDLKPSNIMLGDYGEVYILDWGLARVLGDATTQVVTTDIDSLDGTVEPSQLLGTPGYIAPEQLHTNAEIGRPVDVYALGSILFEILTQQPLHPRQSQAAISSTVSAATDVSPVRRFPDLVIPLELDALCIDALAMSAAARPTARDIALRIQAFLDGDRDLERRKQVATEHLWEARMALADSERATAMRSAGRALGIDPENVGAAELVSSLMLQPPTDPPPELQQALRDADADGVRRHARTAIIAYLAIASFLPIAAWNGIRKWPEVLAVFGVALVLATCAWRIRTQPYRSFVEMVGYAIVNVVLLAMLSRMAGPFVFVPALICVITMSVMAYPAFIERPAVLISLMLLSFLAPIVLEAQGVLARTWELVGDALVSHGEALMVKGAPTYTMLIGATLVTVAIAGIHAAALARTNRRAQHQLVMQAWHLRQLLPLPDPTPEYPTGAPS